MGDLTGVQLVTLRGESPVLISALGPWLGRMDVEKELGGVLRNHPAKLWWVAFLDGDVAGFAGLDRELVRGERVVHLRSAYVRPEHRRRGIYDALVTARVSSSLAAGATLRSVATDMSVGCLRRHGFTEERMKGSYHVMLRIPEGS